MVEGNALNLVAEQGLASPESLHTAALHAMQHNEPERAIVLWSQLLTLKPDDTKDLRLRGSLRAEQGQYSAGYAMSGWRMEELAQRHAGR
jgi:cytochrome c-type biogenesis protein CcmH/NrfG